MSEIIFIHVGQAGAQVGNSCWELFCIEHGLDSSGQVLCPSDSVNSSFFSESISGKFTPRSIFIDTDGTALDNIRKGNLHNPDQIISGREDTMNLFHYGCYLQHELLERSLDAIRKMTENCSNLQGFVIFHSIGGGTGSGLGSRLCERLRFEYLKIPKLGFAVFPSPLLSSTIVEPYNAVLCMHEILESQEATVVLDNEALFEVCKEKLNIERPDYTNINRLIAQVISSITLSFRSESGLNSSISEFQTNLVSFPRIHFLLSSYSPLVQIERAYHIINSVDQITKECFGPGMMMAKCDASTGKYISCCLLYRGDVSPQEVNSAVSQIKYNKTISFTDWCPTGFKCGINEKPPSVPLQSDIAQCSRAVCMVSSNTSIKNTFINMTSKFDKLFSQRGFIHWYVGIGTQGGEFTEAREDLACLISDYLEIEKSEPVG